MYLSYVFYFYENFLPSLCQKPFDFCIACLFKLNTAKISAHVTIICVHTCICTTLVVLNESMLGKW